MVQGQKLQNQWEFRKQDEVHSSDDEPESSSSAEPVFKKLKQISDLMSNKSKQKCVINNSKSMKRKRVRKGNKMQIMKHKKEDDSGYSRVKKRSSHGDDLKNKRGRYEPPTVNSNLIYMQSILEELRVARENMFEWMRGEVRKLMVDSIPELIVEEGCSKWKRIKIKHHGSVESMLNVGMPSPSTEPPRGSMGMTSRGFTSSANPSLTQYPASSTHLTLPTVLPKKGLGSR